MTGGKRLLLGVVLAVLAGPALGGVWWETRAREPASFTTVVVGRGAVTKAVSATGTVNPVLTIIVGSYVSGVIQQLYCDYNTRVRQGQICAKIDPRPYQTVVDQNQAELDVAKAQLEKDRAGLAYAKVNAERNESLAVRNFASQDAADNAKSLYAQSEAQVALDVATVALHQAQLDAAKVNLGYTDIASPVDGTVVSRNVTMGQTIAATLQTPTLFLIATDLTKMQVDANVSESDIGAIKEGDEANFSVDAFPGRVFRGRVVQVRQSPQTVQNVVTYDVVIGVENADLALKPGMTAATQVVLDQHDDVLRVPDQALRFAGGGRVAVLRDGKEAMVTVKTGLDDDSFSEIVAGALQAGDVVITGSARAAAAR